MDCQSGDCSTVSLYTVLLSVIKMQNYYYYAECHFADHHSARKTIARRAKPGLSFQL
jgi:hypothetical protein